LFAYYLHIKPQDWDAMTTRETLALVQFVDDINKERPQ